MIHYHGSPLGGKAVEVHRFFSGRHAMVSFFRPDEISVIAECSHSFALDNGAFSAWTRGVEVDWARYIDWVNLWCTHPGFDFAIIPDVIDGDEQANDDLIEEWIDAGLYHYGVPVWHLHESTQRLTRLADTFPVVALGSSGQYATPNTPTWWARMSEAMDSVVTVDGHPIAKLHGLRMLNPDVFTKIPLHSADSTNAVVNSGSVKRFGMYRPPSRAQRAAIIADRLEQHNSAPFWTGVDEP